MGKKHGKKGGVTEVLKFKNPLMDGPIDAEDDPISPTAVDGDMSEESRWNLDAGEHKGTIGWLKKGEERHAQKVMDNDMNVKYDPNFADHEGFHYLGPVNYSWAFVFKTGVEDDGQDTKKKNDRNSKLDERTSDLPDDHSIPLEAWQLCHRLWKQDFTIAHKVSMLGDKLLILVGLQYKLLVEEAERSRMSVRLIRTKGMHKFDKHMVELYPKGTAWVASPFNSAHRQRLVLERLVRRAKVTPDTMTTHRVKKKHLLHKLMKRHAHREEIRGRHLIELMNVYGAYRPHVKHIIGPTVKRISSAILQDQWMVLKAPENTHRHESNKDNDVVSYENCGQALQELHAYHKGGGEHEHFTGSFEAFFALHEPKTLEDLRIRWGTFSTLSTMWTEGKMPEYASAHALMHPENLNVKQFSPLYQPIDEVRNYFGDHVALYFAWMELYTRALVWPSLLGLLVMIAQVLTSIDGNPSTIPYSIFFAAWSIVFLGHWQRRENELKFLWGSEGFEVKEPARATFVGAHVVNAETNRDEMVYDHLVSRYLRLAVSAAVSCMFIGCTIFCAIQATLVKDNNRMSNAEMADPTISLVEKYKYKVISAGLNLFIIQSFGVIYEVIASGLTSWENHRTKTQVHKQSAAPFDL